MLRRVLVIVLLLLGVAPATATARDLACTGDPATLQRLDLVVDGEPTYGSFVAPAAAPTALVVVGHGFSFNVDGLQDHLRRTVDRTGALALAMNYRGLIDLPEDPTDDNPFQRSRGYPVKAGAEDLVAGARAALRRCPSIRHVALLGISMGANAAGLAVAMRATRDDGRPLFDHWVGVEGVYDMTLLHTLARAGSFLSPFVANARVDIEAETGGTPETVPVAYRERTLVQRADDIAAAGLRGAVLVHGVEDGLAVYPQVLQMAGLLRARGVPTDLYTAFSRGPQDSPDTTLASYAGLRTGLAGHGPEWSPRHVVIGTGFQRLWALLGGAPPACHRNLTVQGAPSVSITPDPDVPARGCPAGTVLSVRRPAPAPATCAPPRVSGVRVRRAARGLVVTGVVRARVCGADGRLRLRIRAADRTRTVALRRAGRFGVRLAGLRRATRATVRILDAGGRSRAVRVRVARR